MLIQELILNPPVKRSKKDFSSQTNDNFNEKLTALEQKLMTSEEEASILEAKFLSYQQETQKEMESMAKSHQDLVKRVAELES